MPYTKKAKDVEGARAEAIDTELSFLAGIAHPAKDKPEITTNGNEVVLPHLTLSSNLSDYLFDGSVSNKGKNFMESLGKVIAFNWYIGQADFNITNVSVQSTWDKLCYPYDFDCCFQNIQSDDSFAKKRTPGYETVDLDAQATGPDVIHAALINLRNSAKVSGIDTTDFDKIFDPKNLSAITKGFNAQLMAISKLPPEKVSSIVAKHTPEGPDREAYNEYLAAKGKQAKEMAVAHIKDLLKAYIDRVERTGFDTFVIMSESRAKNREINYKLAKKYLDSLESGQPLSFNKQAILNEREKIRVAEHGTGANTIGSDELNEIFNIAANLTSTPANDFKNAIAKKPKPTGVVEEVLQQLPSDPSQVPVDFIQLDPQDVMGQIEEGLVDHTPPKYQVKPGTDVTRQLLADLDRLKDRLGGAPNFAGGIVTLNNDDANKTFMGQPLSAVKDWFRMTLQKQWVPQFFWTAVSRLFNVTNNVTPYEEAHQRIQRFGIVSANKEEIHSILDSGDPQRYIEFNQMTGLAWHPSDNGPGMEKFYLRMMDDFLTTYYEDAKARGDDALIEYYKAYSGVCFEDRMKIIEQYMATHPTLEMEAQAQAEVADGEAMDIDPSLIASYDDKTDINNVLYAECGELTARLTKKNGEETVPTPQELWDHLVKKGVAGREFPASDGTGAKVKITADFLNTDEVRSNLIDIVMVLAEGPKIVKAIEMPKDLESVADYDASTDITNVIFQELKELSALIAQKENAEPGRGRMPTMQELWDRLVEKGVAGREFPKSSGSQEQVALSAEYLNKDEVREFFIDDMCAIDDGPKITVKAEVIATEEPQIAPVEDHTSVMSHV